VRGRNLVDFADVAGVRRWFEARPSATCITISARAALRALPFIIRARIVTQRVHYPFLLPSFRRASICWAAARYPDRIGTLRRAAQAATSGAYASDGVSTHAATALILATRAAGSLHPPSDATDAVSTARATNFPGTTPAIQRDADLIESAGSARQQRRCAAELAGKELWEKGPPVEVNEAWVALKNILSSQNEDWDVWVGWYEDRLWGQLSFGEEIDIAIASSPDEFWERGAKAVNARIKQLIAEHTQPEPISAERAGIPASIALDERSIGHWFGTQPREVATNLATRAALRALPLIVAEWERPGFEVLPFFRVAQATWSFTTTPNDSARAAVRAALQPMFENSHAGSAVTLAASATLPQARNNVSEFAARAISAAVRADSTIADDTLSEIMLIERSGDYAARGKVASELASAKLWQGEMARPVADAWALLKSRMLLAGDDWDVWVNWYEDRLAGRPSLGEAFDIAVAMLADKLWVQGPEAVNPVIRRLIEAHSPSEPIPAQGAGPHFVLGPDLKIVLAPPSDFDVDGNNLVRIRQLLPLVRQAAADLAGHINPNTHPELARVLVDYRAAIAGEPETITWGTVFGHGVRLENAASTARREIANRLHEPLEDAAQEALDSVLTFHGPLILASKEGRELTEEADHFRLTRDEQAVLRADVQSVADALKNSPEIIDATAANILVDAAEMIGEGPHPERSAVFSIATLRHAASIFVPAATLASFIPVGGLLGNFFGAAIGAGIAWAGYESLKKSKMYSEATAALGPVWDQLRDATEAQVLQQMIRLAPFRNFVTSTEEPLRRIAHIIRSRWMTRYIDFIVRTNPPQE
jgi:hypothetical protein